VSTQRHDDQVATDSSIGAAIEIYDALLTEDPQGWGAGCWTVIRAGYGRDELLNRLSANWQVLAPVDLEELMRLAYGEVVDADSVGLDAEAWLVTSGPNFGLLEINGFAGSLRETLAALTAGTSARVVSLFWNDAISRVDLAHAVDGDIQSADLVSESYENATDAALVEALGDVLPFRDTASAAAKGLAVVERLSGVRLDDALLGRAWPLVAFEML
jgi:hypothetical protein